MIRRQRSRISRMKVKFSGYFVGNAFQIPLGGRGEDGPAQSAAFLPDGKRYLVLRRSSPSSAGLPGPFARPALTAQRRAAERAPSAAPRLPRHAGQRTTSRWHLLSDPSRSAWRQCLQVSAYTMALGHAPALRRLRINKETETAGPPGPAALRFGLRPSLLTPTRPRRTSPCRAARDRSWWCLPAPSIRRPGS